MADVEFNKDTDEIISNVELKLTRCGWRNILLPAALLCLHALTLVLIAVVISGSGKYS